MGCSVISGTFDGFSAVATEAITGPATALPPAVQQPTKLFSSFKLKELKEPHNFDLNEIEELKDLGL